MFITPIRGPETVGEALFNALQRESRVIIENKFGRQQGWWPILATKYRMKLDYIGVVYRCCVILSNILIIHQHLMRR